jgi:hypothetical protein
LRVLLSQGTELQSYGQREVECSVPMNEGCTENERGPREQLSGWMATRILTRRERLRPDWRWGGSCHKGPTGAGTVERSKIFRRATLETRAREAKEDRAITKQRL